MDVSTLKTVLQHLRRHARSFGNPVLKQIGAAGRKPFRVLVACLLSLRTRDPVTDAASARLFALADTPEQLSALPRAVIQKAIYPAAFYRNKAQNLITLSRILLDRHEGKVPDTLEDLLDLPGVGRKTANLTLIEGFGKPGICVDTHVHRISNRWGLVQTPTPEATEMALRARLPKRWWKEYNHLLVVFGQTCCKPVSPLCGSCSVSRFCPRRGVTRHR